MLGPMVRPVLTALVVGLAVGAAAGAWAGYQWLDGRIAKEEREKLRSQVAESERLASIAQDIGQALAAETRARAGERIEWQRRLKDARGNLVDCKEGGGARLSGDFVRLWDDALFRGQAGDPGRVDGATGGSGVTVEPDEALGNLSENAERWASCRAALRQWQDLARRYGWAK